MRDVALLGVNPGTCTAFLNRGERATGLRSVSWKPFIFSPALTIPGASTKKNNQKTTRCMARSKAIIIVIMADFVPPVREGAMRHGTAGRAKGLSLRASVRLNVVELDARQEWGKPGVNPRSSGGLIFNPPHPGGEGCGVPGEGGHGDRQDHRQRRTAAKRSERNTYDKLEWGGPSSIHPHQ